MNASILTLGAASLVVVDEGHGPMAGDVEDGEYFTTRYPNLDPLLAELAAFGWTYNWPTEDQLILHHCGSDRFLLTEYDLASRRLNVDPLIRIVLEHGGTNTPVPCP